MNDDFRNQVFETLNQKETNELVEIWEKNDRVEWSEIAFGVIREVLQNRLGEIPKQNQPILEYVEQEIEEDEYEELSLLDENIIQNQVVELSENNDINGLVSILENNSDQMLCLEAAMALAQLGDVRGINYLSNASKNPDAEVSSQAIKILAELNNPEGNLELQSQQDNANQSYVPKTIRIQKGSFLTGYIGFIALNMLSSVLLSFMPFPSILRLALLLVAGYYIFKFVVKKTVLSSS
ncbi:MAG: HEAT repeat domain-containing protein [Chloroflexota bacterium]